MGQPKIICEVDTVGRHVSICRSQPEYTFAGNTVNPLEKKRIYVI